MAMGFQIQSQIFINTSATAEEMIINLVGVGIDYSNVLYEGAPMASGTFYNGNTAGLAVNNGVFLCSGSGDIIPGPNNNFGASYNNGSPGSTLLNDISGYNTYDAATLEFDFVAKHDNLFYRFVFGSEEYNEYVGMSFNDVFGLFISGPNPTGGYYENKNFAVISAEPDLIPVCIENVNNGNSANGNPSTGPCTNCAYYIDNYDGNINIQYDGITTTILVEVFLIPDSTYHFVAAIADVGDAYFDSGVLIEKESFESLGPAVFDSFMLKAINNASLDTDIVGEISGNQVLLTVPDDVDRTNLVADYVVGGVHVNVKGVNQVSGSTPNDFSIPVNYDLDGIDTLQWEVVVQTITVIPTQPFSDIVIGPNPSHGSVKIENANGINVVIYTSDGKEINSFENITDDAVEINGLPSGVYFIQLIGNNEKDVRKLVVW